jgi:hypothetical protein
MPRPLLAVHQPASVMTTGWSGYSRATLSTLAWV